jgi:hypothetical protein
LDGLDLVVTPLGKGDAKKERKKEGEKGKTVLVSLQAEPGEGSHEVCLL